MNVREQENVVVGELVYLWYAVGCMSSGIFSGKGYIMDDKGGRKNHLLNVIINQSAYC